MGRPSPCSEEFRADAVRLVVESTRLVRSTRWPWSLGLNREALRSWVRRSEKEAASVAGGGLCAAERAESNEEHRCPREDATWAGSSLDLGLSDGCLR